MRSVWAARARWVRHLELMLSAAIVPAVKTMVAPRGPFKSARSLAAQIDQGMRVSAHIHHSTGRR
ncbi:MAG: hypothetical protein WAK71_04195 [Streptosporangiaceae bacterium]